MENILYTQKIKTDSKEKSIERYEKLTKIVNDNSATVEEKKYAREEAVLYMKNLVLRFIEKKYGNFIKSDPDFFDDLFMSAMEAIITYLPKYDSSKGAPSTFFGFAIQNALYTETTKKFGKNSPQTLLARRIEKLTDEYEAEGKVPTIADYARELGKTETQIKEILRLISITGACSMESISTGVLSGDPSSDRSYSNPENIVMDKATNEYVISRIESSLSEEDLMIFKECIIGGKHYSDIGIEGAKYHRLCNRVRKLLQADPDVIALLRE